MGTDGKHDVVGAPSVGSVYVEASAMDWEALDQPGFWLKRLYQDDAKGEKTWLMKMDPGAYSPPHAHDDFEQVYMLEGSMDDDEKVLSAGDYVCRAPGAVHSATTKTGALAMVVYTRHAPMRQLA